MTEEEVLKEIGEKIKHLTDIGLTETEEYSRLVDEWETLSQNWIEGRILYDDPSQWKDVQDR